jgi:hypothetical protein
VTVARGAVRDTKSTTPSRKKAVGPKVSVATRSLKEEIKYCKDRVIQAEDGLEEALKRACAGESNVNHKPLIELREYYLLRLNTAEAERRRREGRKRSTEPRGAGILDSFSSKPGSEESSGSIQPD